MIGSLKKFLSGMAGAAGSVWQAFKSQFKARPRSSRGERYLAGLYPNGGYGWPGYWTQDRYEQAKHFRHWNYVAINARAANIGILHPNVAFVSPSPPEQPGEYPERGGYQYRKHLNSLYHKKRYAKALTAVQEHEELELLGDDDPLVALFKNPNGPDTAFDFWYELEMFLCLTGNAYVWVLSTNGGYGIPAEMWVIPPHWMFPYPSETRLVDYYEIRPYGMAGGKGNRIIPADEVIHFKKKSPMHKVDGYSPQVAGAEWIDVEESIATAWWSHFKMGAFPGLNLELGEKYEDPSDADLERIYAKFFARLVGERFTGRPVITPPGAKLHPVTTSPAEMDYHNSVPQIRDHVLAIWGVPKGVVGVEPAADEISAYAPMRQFLRFTISPVLRYYGQVLSEKLAPRFGGKRRRRVWWDDPTPDDPNQVNQDLTLDAQNGWITPNEARAVRGRAPYPFGGDDPMLPTGMMPVPWVTGKVAFLDLGGVLGGGTGMGLEGDPASGQQFLEDVQDADKNEEKKARWRILKTILDKCGGPGGKPGPCPVEKPQVEDAGPPEGDPEGGDRRPAINEQVVATLAERASEVPTDAMEAARNTVREVFGKWESERGFDLALSALAGAVEGAVIPDGASADQVALVIAMAELYIEQSEKANGESEKEEKKPKEDSKSRLNGHFANGRH